MKKTEDFNADMVDLQLQVSQAYAAEVHKLRQENKELRAIIAAFPSTATDLQDRVTMLERQLLAEMALQLAMNLEAYDYKRGPQHSQGV